MLKIRSIIDLDDLPEDLKISTMTVTCKFNTEFNVINISKYFDLSYDRCVTIKYGDGDNNVRSLIPYKKKKNKITDNKSKVKRKTFFNQVTLIIRSDVTNDNTNVKLFKNGSVQITGCKGVENFIEILVKICKELKKIKCVMDVKNRSVVYKQFSTYKIYIDQVFDIQIRMINSNFKMDFYIDRDRLYRLLQRSNILCTFEPCVHAAVNIKYEYDKFDTVSIFVFESGSIIITGAKCREHIEKSYDFISRKLYENYTEIFSTKLEEFIKQPDVQELIDMFI